MIELYSRQTPNGRKIAIALEESGLAYTVHAVDFARKEQKSPEFLSLNPERAHSGDHRPRTRRRYGGRDRPLAVFESGAILLYLAEKSRRLLPADPVARVAALQWLLFASTQVTHTAMQVHWLVRKQQAGEAAPHLDDYRAELVRLYGVLDGVLAGRDWLAGADYSVADIAAWTWIERHEMHGIALDTWPSSAAGSRAWPRGRRR